MILTFGGCLEVSQRTQSYGSRFRSYIQSYPEVSLFLNKLCAYGEDKQATLFQESSIMHALYLQDPGPNRIHILHLLKKMCGLSFEQAKNVLAEVRPRLLTGKGSQLRDIQRAFESRGAHMVLEPYPEGIDAAGWVMDSLSIDKKTCVNCGSKLFFAVPGLTTKDEIRQFARSSRISHADEIAKTGWIHPGVYCPNGCGFVMVNLEEDLL